MSSAVSALRMQQFNLSVFNLGFEATTLKNPGERNSIFRHDFL